MNVKGPGSFLEPEIVAFENRLAKLWPGGASVCVGKHPEAPHSSVTLS